MKKIIVNAIPLRGQMNGIGRYISNIFNELMDKKDIDLEFFYGTYFSKKLERDTEINPTLLSVTKNIPFYYALRELYISRAIKYKIKNKKYIYHNPNFISYKLDVPIITNIHDISFIKYPDYHPKKRVDFLTAHIKNSISISDIILTDSNFIRDEIIDYFKISQDRVVSIPLAASKIFTELKSNDIDQVLSSLSLTYKKYFLSISTIEPRKNIISAIKAFINLPTKIQNEYPFVIVGGSGWLNSDFYSLITPLVTTKKIIFLGYLAEEKLPSLYAGAKLFIYLSIYEGFGIPILEASACGTPVITSNTSSIPEIASGFAVMVNPTNIDDICNGIMSIISNDLYEKKLIINGLSNTKKYTWADTANKTLKIYDQLW